MEIMRLMRIILMGIPESQVYYCGIMRIIETTVHSRDSRRLLETQESRILRESHETQGDFRRLMRLGEINGDS